MDYIITTTYGDELYHYGILGQKWGVRRYQNADGTLTAEGKKRYNESGSDKSSHSTKKSSNNGLGKKIVTGVAVTASIGAATYFYMQNKDAIDFAIENALVNLNESAGNLMNDSVDKGKNFVAGQAAKAVNGLKQAGKDFGKGFVDGAKQAPMKLGKAVGEGLALGAAMKLLKDVAGEENVNTYLQQYNAFNKKNKVNLNAFKKGGNNSTSDDEE